MEGVDSLYTEEPEEQQTEEQQQPFQLAIVATVEEDGLTLTPDGAEEPTEKHFKCNTGINFAAGQRVAVLELSGSKVVMFPIGNPGADAPAKIPPGGTTGQVLKKSSNVNYAVEWGSVAALPSGGSTGQVLKKSSATNYACTWGDVAGTLPSGGTDGQVLLKNGSTAYAAKWGTVSAAELKSGYNSLELKTKTLTPSSNGFEIGTSSYPVTVRGDEIVLYYSAYRYCTLACNSSGKLTVNGTAIN